MRGRLAGFTVCVGALLAGCAAGPCDLHSHGACVSFTYDASGIPDLQARVDRLLELEMPFWGLHHIAGWRIEFRNTNHYNCYLNLSNSGCTDFLSQEISVYVQPTFGECFEAAQLLHELGHYTLGDPTHSDPKWRDVPAQFASTVWDRPDAPASCVQRFAGIVTGMWPVNYDGF